MKRKGQSQAAGGASRAAPGSPAAGSIGTHWWWVNQQQSHQQGLDGEYLWSPRRNRNGSNNPSYENMTKVAPGDVIVWSAEGAIRAVGVALSRARDALRPPEFDSAGHQWGTDFGWQVHARFREFERPLPIKDCIPELAGVLPAKHAPLRASGEANPAVYLGAVPGAMIEVLRRLLAGQLEPRIDALKQTAGPEFADEIAEQSIHQRIDIGPTDKATLIKARRGQGVYRTNLERVEGKCRVCGLLDRRHLRASHIKPWRDSSDAEKLDGFNGLLLSPHLGHLFDRGYISFANEGDLLVSRYLNPAVLYCWGLDPTMNVGAFRPEQCKYLEHHRTRVFEKDSAGFAERRSPPAANDPAAST